MENSIVMMQIFLVQINIPVSQELLVVEQKGNPSNKYARGKVLGNGNFGTIFKAKKKVFNNLMAKKIMPKEA
jgi:hypothetical protein